MRLIPACAVWAVLVAAGCAPGGPADRPPDGALFAPGVDPRGTAEDGLTVGHRLLAAGEPQLALDAYLRAAGTEGLTPEVLSALGSANLALGRLNQAEDLLRRATDAAPDSAPAWNNLGVVATERGQQAEAERAFRRAFALDGGQNPEIRDNLRLALANREDPGYTPGQEKNFRLVRLGGGAYSLQSAPHEAEQ